MSRHSYRKPLIAATIALAATLTACGEPSTENGAGGTLTTPNKNEGLFDPCSIPDDALAAAGLDPATEDAGFFGVQRTGWEVCGWTGSWFFIDVLSTSHTFDDVKNNPANTDLAPVDLPGREAVSFRHVSDDDAEVCDVAFPSSSGTITVRSYKKGSEAAEESLCELALDYAHTFDEHLPR
ncbi:DUF3558 domain-containing protein [Rhodococcus triatomae]|uniref:DUF3558 domain-containing protein n=1 Tax=Rhodococcus triatomae TaxID=300028 RepID=A0A1G8EWA7_9NOCA|nr:DUF3558 domain-containing protein [Rhodococcus triatomae]QNG19313.1 DUF3558 domain-containing protein [Rhodococcus triatomae]QNG24774.1 DUF3558 domain-containing protein [Rhodococcus triatomae]SDH74130.1 Protein of unknown function [Rhodococcus triatomae]